jgi:hypothetical protein
MIFENSKNQKIKYWRIRIIKQAGSKVQINGRKERRKKGERKKTERERKKHESADVSCVC